MSQHKKRIVFDRPAKDNHGLEISLGPDDSLLLVGLDAQMRPRAFLALPIEHQDEMAQTLGYMYNMHRGWDPTQQLERSKEDESTKTLVGSPGLQDKRPKSRKRAR